MPEPAVAAPAKARSSHQVPFGVNEVRLNARHWLALALILVLIALFTPRLWEKIERLETGPDYRLPYQLSKDYWLYGRRLRQEARPQKLIVLGDSVVWGEYVLPDATLSHFLGRETGQPDRFVNAGVNGMFPLALEGLVRYYGGALAHRKVLLHCNVLWMTSPKADLRVDKEEQFNHARLVPQFQPRIPCYKADANERLTAVCEREVPFLAWVAHLQHAYFKQKSILSWTLEDDGGDPPHYPNVRKNPFAQITLALPAAPANDPDRGPRSPRHKAWSDGGNNPVHFDWVGLDASLQWGAFQRLAELLRARGSDVLVLLGPFNEHLMDPENRPAFRKLREGIIAWLSANQIPYVAPETLPSLLYADASHPLSEGYALLAKRVNADAAFQNWLKRRE